MPFLPSRATPLVVTLTLALLAAVPPVPIAAQSSAAFDDKMRAAESLVERRLFESALKAYNDAIKLDKKSPGALVGIARAYSGVGDHKRAIESCTEALKYVESNPALEVSALSVRGMAHFAQANKPSDKRLKLAEADFRSALANPLGGGAKYHLGLTLLKQGRTEEGVRELEEFLRRWPNAAEARLATRYIKNPHHIRENVAPEFSIRTLDGEDLTSEALLGKVVLIDFWATWCAPCIKATPGLAKIHKRLNSPDFVIVGISADQNPDAWRAFIQKNQLGWAHFLDINRLIAQRFDLEAFPTYILIDHEGIIRYRRRGWSPTVDSQIEGQARKLLKALPLVR